MRYDAVDALLYGLAPTRGIELRSSKYLTVERPHILSSERTLAKVAGGRWSPKWETVPDPKLYRLPTGEIIGHPETIRILRDRLKAKGLGAAP